MSTFLLTRRNALIGGLTSLIIPSAAVALEKARPVADPWQEAGDFAFALHDRLATMPEGQFWWCSVGPGKGRGDAVHFFGDGGRTFYRAERQVRA